MNNTKTIRNKHCNLYEMVALELNEKLCNREAMTFCNFCRKTFCQFHYEIVLTGTVDTEYSYELRMCENCKSVDTQVLGQIVSDAHGLENFPEGEGKGDADRIFSILSDTTEIDMSRRTMNLGVTTVNESPTCVGGVETVLEQQETSESNTHIDVDQPLSESGMEAEYDFIDAVATTLMAEDEGSLGSENDVDDVKDVTPTQSSTLVTENSNFAIKVIDDTPLNDGGGETTHQQEVAYIPTDDDTEVLIDDVDDDGFSESNDQDLLPCDCFSCYYCGVN